MGEVIGDSGFVDRVRRGRSGLDSFAGIVEKGDIVSVWSIRDEILQFRSLMRLADDVGYDLERLCEEYLILNHEYDCHHCPSVSAEYYRVRNDFVVSLLESKLRSYRKEVVDGREE